MTEDSQAPVLIDEKRLIKERKARTKAYFNDPETLDVICSHVANGGTVVSLAKSWDVRYSDLTRWLHSDPVRNKQYQMAMKDRNEWVVESVLQELRSIALIDVRRLYDDNGNLLPVGSWPEDVAKAVAGIEVSEEWAGKGDNRAQVGELKKVRMNDKLKALELLGKNLALFTDKETEDRVMRLEDLVMASYQPKIPHRDVSPKGDDHES